MFYLQGLHSIETGQKCTLSVVPYKINIENNILSILCDVISRNTVLMLNVNLYQMCCRYAYELKFGKSELVGLIESQFVFR